MKNLLFIIFAVSAISISTNASAKLLTNNPIKQQNKLKAFRHIILIFNYLNYKKINYPVKFL